ncbi:hydantoinase/oxoprolinase family protein [Nibrella saemangeumensis]
MYNLGIDIGNTFTDFVLLETISGYLAFGKTLTTHDDLTQGVLVGFDELLERNEVEPAEIHAVYLGSMLVDQLDISKLRNRLGALDFQGKFWLMTAGGWLVSPDQTPQLTPARLRSGSAGGAMAGAFFSYIGRYATLITIDVGGANAELSLIIQHQPQYVLAPLPDSQTGTLPAQPVIEVTEVPVGGRSIAWLDEQGQLRLGPEIVPHELGPVCFNRGGTQPTLTDASLVLGYLGENFFLGGVIEISRDAAIRAIDEQIARPLGLSVEEAAMAIHERANDQIAAAARKLLAHLTLDRGSISLMAIGGGGPLHVYELARLLQMPEVMVPVGAGVTSALGCLVSPVAAERIRQHFSPLETIDWDFLNGMLGQMAEDARTELRNAGLDPDEARITRAGFMRLLGIHDEVFIPLPDGVLSPESQPAIRELFVEAYRRRGRFVVEGRTIEAVAWQVLVSMPALKFGPRRVDAFNKYSIGGKDFSALKGYRQVYYLGDPVPCSCPVYDRHRIRPNDTLSGPVIIEEDETTVVIGPKTYVRMDTNRNLFITVRL